MRELKQDPCQLAADIVRLAKERSVHPCDLHRAVTLKISVLPVLIDVAMMEGLDIDPLRFSEKFQFKRQRESAVLLLSRPKT